MPATKEQIRQIIADNNLSSAAYIVLGITADGYKDILSITVGANETSKFWLGMLNDLKNRGVQDVLFFCVDGLPGFKEAIGAVYPDARIQRCVIHMLRNSFKYVNYSVNGRQCVPIQSWSKPV